MHLYDFTFFIKKINAMNNILKGSILGLRLFFQWNIINKNRTKIWQDIPVG